MASNCSGALVLTEAGVLDGKRARTWAGGEAAFQKKYPDVLVQHDINVVIDDGVLTSNGNVVSYEAAIALLAKLTSDEFAAEVELTWRGVIRERTRTGLAVAKALLRVSRQFH